MSKALMLSVWDCDLPHGEKCVLAAMAYNGDDEGNNIWPSIETIARRAGYSERMTRYIIAKLKEKNILVVAERKGRRHGYVVNYSIDLSEVPPLPPSDTLQPLQPIERDGDVTEALQRQRVQSEPDRVQSVQQRMQSTTPKGAIAIAEEQEGTVVKEQERKVGSFSAFSGKSEKLKPATIAALSDEELKANRERLRQQAEELKAKFLGSKSFESSYPTPEKGTSGT